MSRGHNEAEGVFGTGKTAYGLGRISVRPEGTSRCVIGMAPLLMDLGKGLRSFFRLFLYVVFYLPHMFFLESSYFGMAAKQTLFIIQASSPKFKRNFWALFENWRIRVDAPAGFTVKRNRNVVVKNCDRVYKAVNQTPMFFQPGHIQSTNICKLICAKFLIRPVYPFTHNANG